MTNQTNIFPQRSLSELIADDSHALMFQTSGQYRAALLRHDKAQQSTAPSTRASPEIPTTQAELVLMPRELTAENGAKNSLSGEFVESITVSCHECDGAGEVDDGYKCAECDGDGMVEQRVTVEWDTIKRIYAHAVALLAQPVRGLTQIDGARQKGE